MLEQVVGLDHVVIAVRDLERAASAWRALGFTLSPRGTHSAHMGTGNYTIMFGDDYLELLGVVAPTPRNAPLRAFLDEREGIERLAFTAIDAAAGVAELQARGIAATGPLDFARPVDLPGGGTAHARFRTFDWPADQRPAGARLFACQHLTRDAVWIPELQRHANSALRIQRVELLSLDPRAAASRMARLIDQPTQAMEQGAWRVPSGGARADLVFLGPEALAARYPGVATGSLPPESVAALVLRVAEPERARTALRPVRTTALPEGLAVAPDEATGLILAFVA
jgi:catechol 2,3-dioxygenase-like lactoylglutathione lyase family enzyme